MCDFRELNSLADNRNAERRLLVLSLACDEEKTMRAQLSLGALATALMLSSGAAQTTTGTIVAPDAIDLGPDQEIVVREYIIRRRPAVVESGVTIRPGSVIPDYVELQTFDELAVPSLRRYAYFISPDGKIVVIEPESRQVVRILDRQP